VIKNMGSADRIIRVLVAIAIALLYFTRQISGTLGIILGILAIIFLLTSLGDSAPSTCLSSYRPKRRRASSDSIGCPPIEQERGESLAGPSYLRTTGKPQLRGKNWYNKLMAKDPVCGMEVPEGRAAATSEYGAKPTIFARNTARKNSTSSRKISFALLDPVRHEASLRDDL